MATSPLVPKEQLSAYQRWELGSFDAPGRQSPNTVPHAELARQSGVRARTEGYAAGHREGLEAGRSAGIAEVIAKIPSSWKNTEAAAGDGRYERMRKVLPTKMQ